MVALIVKALHEDVTRSLFLAGYDV